MVLRLGMENRSRRRDVSFCAISLDFSLEKCEGFVRVVTDNVFISLRGIFICRDGSFSAIHFIFHSKYYVTVSTECHGVTTYICPRGISKGGKTHSVNEAISAKTAKTQLTVHTKLIS